MDPAAEHSSPWRRSVKRKLDPDADVAAVTADVAVARVEAEDEAAALREAVVRAQETIALLRAEVDEERGAAASAASEAMAMMLRLQREKAEALMESRQFRRFAEEKMALDADEIAALEGLLASRDSDLLFLSSRLDSYRLYLRRLGLPLPEDDHEDHHNRYPQLRCGDLDADEETEGLTLESSAAPLPLVDLERRIHRLEHESPTTAEKGVVEDDDERRHFYDDEEEDDASLEEPPSPPLGRHHLYDEPQERRSLYEEDDFPESSSPVALDDDNCDNGSDRVYTVDAVQCAAAPTVRVSDECDNKDSGSAAAAGERRKELEPDIKKLYMRLEALEADRESMRQALVAMRTEKAQLVLLREIAQQLAKEATPAPTPAPAPVVTPLRVPLPERRTVAEKKNALVKVFSIVTLFKWILTLVSWRKKKVSRSRYTFGLSSNNVGLLVLLDKSPRIGRWKCLSRT